MWAAEAAVHGKPLTLPPQKDRNKARQTDRKTGKSQRRRDRKFGDLESVEGHTPGVGSSPTAEMEGEESGEAREGTADKDNTQGDTEVVFLGLVWFHCEISV